jgi:two-component system NtrC family sensor kinase
MSGGMASYLVLVPEVSCVVFEFFVRHAQLHGLDLEELVEGCGAPLAELRNPRRFVSWETWAVLSERLEERIGPEAIVEAGRSIPLDDYSRPMQDLAGVLWTPPQLFDGVFRWLGPFFFRAHRWEILDRGPNHVRLRITVPAPASPAWFRMAEGSFEALPTLLGADPGIVATTVEGRTATFDVQCPPKTTFAQRARLLVEAPFRLGRVLDQLAQMQERLRQAYGVLATRDRERRRILDALPSPVLVHGEGEDLFVNLAFRRTFGTRGLGELLPGEIADVLAEREGSLEVHLADTEEGPRWFAIAPPVELRFRERPARLLTFRDVTAEHTEAERLALQDRLAALGTVAACVGHEINTPLAYVTGLLEVLREDARDRTVTPQQITEGVDLALEGLGQVRDITRDVSVFARTTAEVRRVDLRQVLETALRLARPELVPVAAVELQGMEQEVAVAGDAGRLGQVFLNVVLNAAHAMAEASRPPGGHRLRITVEKEDDAVRVAIGDTGGGVPPALATRIFEPFFTTKRDGGTGLGLPVCRQIVEEHEGAIALRSGDAGATFEVTLPLAGSVAEAPVGGPSSLPRSALRILVIDDEPTLGRVLKRLLREHRVTLEEDAPTALIRLLGGEEYDAILCDVMMPALDGTELHRRLAEARPEQAEKLLFLTGGAIDPAIRAYLEAHPRPALLKPFRREELLEALAEVDPALA